MAVLELVLALEQRFGIEIDGEDVTAEIFETLGAAHRARERPGRLRTRPDMPSSGPSA